MSSTASPGQFKLFSEAETVIQGVQTPETTSGTPSISLNCLNSSRQSTPLTEQIAAYLGTLLPGSRPRRVARMLNYTHGGDKYRDISRSAPFGAAHLRAHAAGGATWATTLDTNGQAQLGAIDADEGGRSAVLTVLGTAADLGLIAFAIAVDNPLNGHSGGHVWFIYDRRYAAGDIAAQLRQVAARAGLPDTTEIWPDSNQVIRLPFGQHRWAQTRGELLLQSGEVVDLDSDLAAGFAAVADLPRNGEPPAAPAPAPAPNVPKMVRRISPGEQAAERASLTDVRTRFNAEHSLEQLLADYGATPAPGGYSCPCGVPHTHQTTLAISRQGRLFSYSRRCRWYTEKGWDAFGLYVLVEHHNNITDALKALNPIEDSGSKPLARSDLPTGNPPEYLTPAEDARRRADRERKRAKSQAERAARTTRIPALEAQAAADTKICAYDRLLWAYHIQRWREYDAPEHYDSNERIARAVLSIDRPPTTNELRRLRLAHGRLIARGYLVRTIRWQPGEQNTNCWQPGAGAEGGMVIPADRRGITMLESHDSNTTLNPRTCEGGASPHPDRELLSYVRALAAELGDTAVLLRDYAELPIAQLLEAAQILEAQLCRTASRPKPDTYQVLNPPPVADSQVEKSELAALDQAERYPGNSQDGQLVEPGGMADREGAPEMDPRPGAGGAWYDPAADWTAGGVLDLSQWRDPRDICAQISDSLDDQVPDARLDEEREPEPLVRCAPIEPKAAAEYWALKNKKPLTFAQRRWIARRLAELEIWLPVSQALARAPASAQNWGSSPVARGQLNEAPASAQRRRRPAAAGAEARSGKSRSAAGNSPPLTSSSAGAGQALDMFAGLLPAVRANGP